METTRKMVQALGLLAMVAAAPAALAAEGSQLLDRVEVQRAAAYRSDVTRSCPAVQADLQEALERAITKHQIEGSYPVTFEMRNNGVVEVRTPRAPKEYGFLLRRAVKGLDCQDSASMQQAQRFGFLLDIKLDDGDGSRLASAGGGRVSVGLRALP